MECQFIKPQQLRPTEEHDAEAASELAATILRDGFWRTPVLIHRGNLAILDGHHRRQAAIDLRLSVIPCLVCSYAQDNIQLGTWRPDYRPTVSDVFRAASTGHLLPCKTTRHHVPKLGLDFAIPLELLLGHGQPAADGWHCRSNQLERDAMLANVKRLHDSDDASGA
jgi:ParB-like nuclease domain